MQQEGVTGLLLHPPRTVRLCGQKCLFFGVSGVGEVTIHQPILHNGKGSNSRLAGVVGRCLVFEDRLMFLQAISVARRYAPLQLPRDSYQVMRSMSQRCRSGLGLTSREARTIANIVACRMLLPLPFHSRVPSFCHINVLLYAVDHSLWRALVATHTFLVHLIAKFAKQGCTNTLYFHGFSHVWFGDRLPIQFGDKAEEAYLRMAKRFAPVTSTEPAASVEDGWKHELHTQFWKSKTKGKGAHFGGLYGSVQYLNNVWLVVLLYGRKSSFGWWTPWYRHPNAFCSCIVPHNQ